MRTGLFGIAICALAMGSALGTAHAGDRVEHTGLGFSTPEAILYDAKNDVYLVSNINGNPSAADDNGYISRISPDGGVLDLKWIDGADSDVDLSAPKGMAISGGVLYVSDITHVRMFDPNTGAPKGTVAVSGTSFLNDVAPGPNGSVYISDTGIDVSTGEAQPTGTDAIYRIDTSGAATKLVDGDLDKPNGLAVRPDGAILMVAFGDKGVLSVYSPDGSLKDSMEIGTTNNDGIELLSDGSVLISSWETNSVHKVSRDRGPLVIVDNVPTPADLGYDTKRNRVLIPIFTEDRLVFVELD